MTVKKVEFREEVAEIQETHVVLQHVENHMMNYPNFICNLFTKNLMNNWMINQLRRLKLRQDLLIKQIT
jgi:hypothetical protein